MRHLQYMDNKLSKPPACLKRPHGYHWSRSVGLSLWHATGPLKGRPLPQARARGWQWGGLQTLAAHAGCAARSGESTAYSAGRQIVLSDGEWRSAGPEDCWRKAQINVEGELMGTIYLDRQLIIEAYQGVDEINDAIKKCESRGFIFPYSPAHIEEVSGAFCQDKIADIDQQISHLNQLSKGVAFMPHQTKHAELRLEDINACLSRVKANGGRAETERAVQIEQDNLEKIKSCFNADEKFWNSMHKKCEEMSHEEIFSEWNVFSFLDYCAITQGFRIRTDAFCEREATIEVLFKVLNFFGFRKEHSPKRVENRLHDVSHAIYASYADIFVTNDRKLRHSAMAIFSLIGIQTRVLDRAGFLNFSGSA